MLGYQIHYFDAIKVNYTCDMVWLFTHKNDCICLLTRKWMHLSNNVHTCIRTFKCICFSMYICYHIFVTYIVDVAEINQSIRKCIKIVNICKIYRIDNFLFCIFTLTFILLKLNVSSTENSVDPDQLASSEASWSGSSLFFIHPVNP